MLINRHIVATVILCPVLWGLSAVDPLPRVLANAQQPVAVPKDLETRELKKLQGEWKVVRRQFLGQTQQGNQGTFTFNGNTLKFTLEGNIHKRGDFTLDVSSRPKRLIWTFQNQKNEKVTVGYIYSFDDDHLLLTCSMVGWGYQKQPPADFGSNTTEFLRLEPIRD